MSDALVARSGNHARFRQCRVWANGRGIGRSMDVTLRWAVEHKQAKRKIRGTLQLLLLSSSLRSGPKFESECKDTPLLVLVAQQPRFICSPTRRSVPRPLAWESQGGTQINADDRTDRLMITIDAARNHSRLCYAGFWFDNIRPKRMRGARQKIRYDANQHARRGYMYDDAWPGLCQVTGSTQGRKGKRNSGTAEEYPPRSKMRRTERRHR